MTEESELNKVNKSTLRGGETTNVYGFCNQYQYVINNYTEHCAACSSQTQTASVFQNADSKHEDLTQCCFNVGPALAVGQY